MMKGRESGQSIMALLVALGMSSIFLLMVVGGARYLIVHGLILQGRVELLDSLIEAEDFFRKELGRLQFVPYCSGLLPAYQEMGVGKGVAYDYREYLQKSVIISSPRVHEVEFDLWNLRGSGSGGFVPQPRKGITSIVRGSQLFQVSGLLPTRLRVIQGDLVGDLSADLVGIRSAIFYITDCRNSAVLSARREGDRFKISQEDYLLLQDRYEAKHLHVYLVKEYLVYLQVRQGISYLVVDFLDGQAFLRIPGFIDLQVSVGDILSIGVLVGKASLHEKKERMFAVDGREWRLKNIESLEYRQIEIGLE